jgi:hypothetical protein
MSASYTAAATGMDDEFTEGCPFWGVKKPQIALFRPVYRH